MKRFLALLCLTALLSGTAVIGAPQTAPPPAPKLVLLLIIDQFRYDYLTRWRDQYTGGLDRLLTQGAGFTNAHLAHYPTVTAPGHAAAVSGATPALSGIIGNDWYDRESGKQVTSVSDDEVRLVGRSDAGSDDASDEAGASPHRLLVTTLADELKLAFGAASRVVGISLKDRGAILPAGHRPDGAYWLDLQTGNFVSSTYYFSELPAWVREFNRQRLADQFAGAQWDVPGANDSGGFRMPPQPGPELYEAIYGSAFGNDLLAAFAEQTLLAEQLGRHDRTDFLSVSFSSNDVLGHMVGPDSPAVRDISIRTDRLLGRLLDQVDRSVGLANTLVVLTSDHGVAPLPEQLAERKIPGGRMQSASLFGPIQSALAERYGEGKWILATAGTSPYLNHELIAQKGLDPAAVRRVAARAAAAVPHVSRVYTSDQLLLGQTNGDLFSRRVLRSFHPQRSGDLEILLEPNWIRQTRGTTHGTPYSYDSHIPLLLMGPGIKPGSYPQNVTLNDLAPTLATLLAIETPNGSVGRVLHEILH